MKLLIVFTGVMLWAAPLLAETYSWVDEKGTYNFTEDYSRVPQKYRKNVEKRDSIEAPPIPAASSTASSAGSAAKSAAGTGKENVQAVAPEKLFGGKTQAAWLQELTTAQNELKRLDARVKELGMQVKNAGAYNVTRSYVDLERHYNATVEEYNKANIRFGSLMDSARKAGLPL
jgi:replicative superfamily II helicase